MLAEEWRHGQDHLFRGSLAHPRHLHSGGKLFAEPRLAYGRRCDEEYRHFLHKSEIVREPLLLLRYVRAGAQICLYIDIHMYTYIYYIFTPEEYRHFLNKGQGV